MQIRNTDKHTDPIVNNTIAGYGKSVINWGIWGNPIRFVKVPPIKIPILPAKRLNATPSIPIIIPAILVRIGQKTIIPRIIMHNFKNLSTLGEDLVWYLLAFWSLLKL